MKLLKSIVYVLVFFVLFFFMIMAYDVHNFLSLHFAPFEARWLSVFAYCMTTLAFILFAYYSHKEDGRVPDSFIACIMVSALVTLKFMLT